MPSRRPNVPPDAARHAAMSRIADQTLVFPVLEFHGPATQGLSELDAAFAYAIYDATLRRWYTLEYFIRSFLREDYDGLEPPIKSALLAGAAQLMLLDRVPRHAAVSEAVNWAKWATNERAGGLVNAVLRRITEDLLGGQDRQLLGAWDGGRDSIPLDNGHSLKLIRALLPEDPLERLAVATSHPRSILSQWQQQYGDQTTRQIAVHDLVNPPTILSLGTTSIQHPNLIPHSHPSHAVFDGTRTSLLELLATHPSIWAQDTTSSGAIESVAEFNPGLIIDVCAGQGTKTRQLARTFPKAQIVATDTDRNRVATLRQATSTNPRITVTDHATLGRHHAGTADLVLLDVPCTNSGVLARRVEARYRFDKDQMARMIETQRQILVDSLRLLKPTGVILYATCSMEKWENQSMMEWATSSGLWAVSRARHVMPSGLPGENPRTYADGGFSALLSPSTPKKSSRSKSKSTV